MEEDGVVRWERFMPRPSLTVLLVEKDDSTREIVAALLKKCGYTVVLATDGLKAWEIIKEKGQQIDLVLTEVELPQMSGFSLLSMIVDKESYQNVPVILMSSHDSINMVFKCLLKGAADFLVKPIRKNELRNLWQHVWRRLISKGESGGSDTSQGMSLANQKCKNNLGNHTSSSHSSENIACIERKGGISDEGSDTQNSCTKQGMDLESTCIQKLQELSQINLTSNLNNIVSKQNEAGEISSQNEMVNDIVKHWDSTPSKGFCQNVETVGSQQVKSREIADLLGAMDRKTESAPRNNPTGTTCDNKSKNSGIPVVESDQLELSLRRCQPEICDGTSNGCLMLSHSSSSAFSRYNSRYVPPNCHSTEPNVAKEDFLECHCPYQSSKDPSDPTCSKLPGTVESTVISSSQDCKPVQCVQTGSSSFPVPFVPCDNFIPGFGFSLQPLVDRRFGPPPWSTKPTIQKAIPVSFSKQSGSKILDSIKFHYSHETGNIEKDQPEDENVKKFESTEDIKVASTVTGQSASRSVCNGSDNFCRIGVESVYNGNSDNMVPPISKKTSGETANDVRVLNQGSGIELTDFHGSIGREAALTKYRLKRKDRCFEKKVRYHSRQKLAEQRPRVKGQFVRRAA